MDSTSEVEQATALSQVAADILQRRHGCPCHGGSSPRSFCRGSADCEGNASHYLPQVARLRLHGNYHSCSTSAMTLKLAIEEAIQKMAPDLAGFEVEGGSEGMTEPRSRKPFAALQRLVQTGHTSRQI